MTDSAKEILAGLRWTSDRIVKNYFGERVWLKQIDGGITDCCAENAPCEYHSKLTCQAPGSVQ